jgi:hypothetical protein
LVGVALGSGVAAAVSNGIVVETDAVAVRLGTAVRVAVGLAVSVGLAVEDGVGRAGWGVPVGFASATVGGGSVGGGLNSRSGIWLQAASERIQARPRIRKGTRASRKGSMREKVLQLLVSEGYDDNYGCNVPVTGASITQATGSVNARRASG